MSKPVIVPVSAETLTQGPDGYSRFLFVAFLVAGTWTGSASSAYDLGGIALGPNGLPTYPVVKAVQADLAKSAPYPYAQACVTNIIRLDFLAAS